MTAPARAGRLVDLVRDGDVCLVGTGAGEPRALLDELVRDVAPARAGLTFYQVLTGASGRLFDVVPHGHRISTPVPSGSRAPGRTHDLELVDRSMGQWARAIAAGRLRVDGVLLSVVRAGDRLHPFPTVDLGIAAFERARFRAVDVLAGPPVTTGPSFHVDDVDYVVTTSAPLPEFHEADPDPAAERIAALIAELVPRDAVLELGVGRALAAVPDALVRAGRPLAVHTGLLSDWGQALVEGGVATRALPCAGGRSVVATITLGCAAFYSWLGGTDAVTLAESRHAQDPLHLGGLTPFVAINSAMVVDLTGQVGLPANARDAHGPGGLLDFAIAGSYGGLSIIALNASSSTGRSRVVADLSTVHLPSSLVTHVVTEHGVADLRERSPQERRRQLLAVADPEHRATLRDDGEVAP